MCFFAEYVLRDLHEFLLEPAEVGRAGLHRRQLDLEIAPLLQQVQAGEPARVLELLADRLPAASSRSRACACGPAWACWPRGLRGSDPQCGRGCALRRAPPCACPTSAFSWYAWPSFTSSNRARCISEKSPASIFAHRGRVPCTIARRLMRARAAAGRSLISVAMERPLHQQLGMTDDELAAVVGELGPRADATSSSRCTR